jgi:transposase
MSKKYPEYLTQQELSPSDQNAGPNHQSVSEMSEITPQVKVKKPRAIRRQFSVSDKIKILTAFDTCNGSLERGALLRKEGLYYASISKWKKELCEKKSSRENFKLHQRDLAHQQLLRENSRLKKKLSQAEAIIEIQKKMSKLLSDHVIDQETNEVQS